MNCQFIILILAAFGSTSLNSEELYENSSCQTKSGVAGTCRESHSCRWLLEGLKKRTIKHSDIVRCGWDGDLEIVCCADAQQPITVAIPTSTLTATPTPAPTSAPTVAPVIEPYLPSEPTQPPTTQPRLGARKSEVACHIYSVYFNPKIIGGVDADLGEYPHMAAIGRESDEAGEAYDWFCGGSLISERYVLTAAHCTAYRDRKPTIVRLNDVNLAVTDKDELTVKIITIINHPEYRTSRNYNDLSLLHLESDVAFSSDVNPACLWTKTDETELVDDVLHTVSASGFGVRSIERKQTSKILLKVGLNVIGLTACNTSYIEYGGIRVLPDYVLPSQLCAFDHDRKNDTCQGDSGGPLQKFDKITQHDFLIGVTSFGISCGSSIPSVYTRVSYYLDWIESIVWP